MVEGWGRGEREAFAKDRGFWGNEGVRRQVHDRSGIGILGRLKFLWKFRRGVRESGEVEVGGKRWFVGDKGPGDGKGVAKREAAASTEKINAEI